MCCDGVGCAGLEWDGMGCAGMGDSQILETTGDSSRTKSNTREFGNRSRDGSAQTVERKLTGHGEDRWRYLSQHLREYLRHHV